MTPRYRSRWAILTLLTITALTVVGCASLAGILSRRWIPDCGAPSHDECCQEYLGEDYVCTGTRINEAGEAEIECSHKVP
jgi:hypothetical protein